MSNWLSDIFVYAGVPAASYILSIARSMTMAPNWFRRYRQGILVGGGMFYILVSLFLFTISAFHLEHALFAWMRR